MKTLIISLITILSTLFCLGNEVEEAKIIVKYTIGINYVTHLYTIANIGFEDQEYVDKFGFSVSKEDISKLKEHSSLMKFANGKNGIYSDFCFFIPSYADLKSKHDYQMYLKDIDIAIKDKSHQTLLKYFPDSKKDMLKRKFEMDDKNWEDYVSSYPILREIMDVYINNIDTYLTDVFPKVEEDLMRKVEALNILLANNDIIEKWENVTNMDWVHGNYYYLLFRAGEKGPSFNNLSDNINSLYYNIGDEYLVDMFSHEFGIFLMFDSIIPIHNIMDKEYPPYHNDITLGRVNWMAFEMLSMFYNCKINKKNTLDYYTFGHSDPIAFKEIYESLYKSGVTNPVELYKRGINEYMKPDGKWETGLEERNKKLLEEWKNLKRN